MLSQRSRVFFFFSIKNNLLCFAYNRVQQHKEKFEIARTTVDDVIFSLYRKLYVYFFITHLFFENFSTTALQFLTTFVDSGSRVRNIWLVDKEIAEKSVARIKVKTK